MRHATIAKTLANNDRKNETMKHLFRYILIIVIFNSELFAQQTFEKIISYPEDQVINSVIEDDNGNYYMIGRIKNLETNQFNSYLIKIDNTGNIIQEEIISPVDATSCIFLNIHFFNNHLNIIGTEMVEYPNISKLWYLELNTNLEIENEKLLSIPYGRWFSYMNSIMDSDSNFIVTGYTSRIDNNNNYNSDAFFYKLNNSGDSLTSRFCTSEIPFHTSFDIIESQDSSKYYAFVSHFTNIYGSSGQRLTLNKNLDSLAIDSIPMSIFDYYSPVYLNETDILICGKIIPWSSEEVSLNVISINEQAELIDFNSFNLDGDMRENPAIYSGVSRNENNIFVGGTSNFDHTNPFYSSINSWFHLIKINTEITPIWEYWYGGDAYYQLYTILATNDGGCLLVGNRYDDEIQDMERDIYIAKVNNEGLIVWTQEIPIEKQMTTVYPNPGRNILNIDTDHSELVFELININGRVVIRQIPDNNHKTINTESLKPGIYFYRLFHKNDKTLETGKWIKR